MIGLIALGVIVLWFVAAAMLSARIPRWLGLKTHHRVLSMMLFPLILAAPLADEFIGRWQFKRLCEREATVTLSPEWQSVQRVKENEFHLERLPGYVIPIDAQPVVYTDLDTGKPFLSYRGFHARGGLLMGRLGLGLGGTTSCWPSDSHALYTNLKINELLKRGEAK